MTDYHHYWQLITLAPSLQRLARMASLAVEADLGTRQRGRRGPAVVFDVRYRIETIPARYARVMRQPRMRLYDLESAEVSKVSRLLSWDGDIAEVAWYVESLLRDRQVQQISRKLEEAAGTSLSGIAASFGPLLQELAVTEPPSATELPFGGELSYILGDARSLAAEFIDQREHRDYPVSEEDATKRVMRRVAQGRRGNSDGLAGLVDAVRIGKLAMVLATTRREDGAELGLAHPAAPADGWPGWYRRMLEHARQMLKERNAGLDAAKPMVLPPSDDHFPDPPALADPRYRYAARFVASFEGNGGGGSLNYPSLESCRFHRAHLAIGLWPSDAYELLYEHAHRLIADVEWDNRGDYLGRNELARSILGQAAEPLGPATDLTGAISWYVPRDDPFGITSAPRRYGVGADNTGFFTSLQALPMNRWEVRFRYPELTDLCSRIAPGSETGGLGAAVASFIGAREPCRIWLPPVVGELYEIVSLLPSDRDLDYAMHHLGADGAVWRDALLRAADAITDHIWAHEDDPAGPSDNPVAALRADTAGPGRTRPDHDAGDERMAELEALLRSLSSRASAVYTRVGQSGHASIADDVYAVTIKAARDWPGEGVQPSSPAAVAEILRPIATDEAVELMTDLSTRDLAYTSIVDGDPWEARREAVRVAEILGPETDWLTNTEQMSGGSRGWTSVTSHTFDGVVAAEGNGLRIVLLQVAED